MHQPDPSKTDQQGKILSSAQNYLDKFRQFHAIPFVLFLILGSRGTVTLPVQAGGALSWLGNAS